MKKYLVIIILQFSTLLSHLLKYPLDRITTA